MPLQPTTLAYAEDGTPYSATFGDVYHSRDGGLEQARFVFLGGNGLPVRWRGRPVFTVLETGFGLGLNFLATWAAWRADPERCERLHFVSAELHPFTAQDLARLHARWPELVPLAEALHAQWPPLTPGFHRIHLDDGRVTLTLLFGDARETLRQLACRANAIYLDGFSPARNPELWTEDLLAELARLAAPGATLATWSVSGAVRKALGDVGFTCSKRPGFAAKRKMLEARFHGDDADLSTHASRRALILGAGLAGSSLAHRLAERGWSVSVIDAANGPGEGASGNLSGVLRPLPSLDDNRLARITRAGTLYGLHHLRRLTAAGLPVRWDACGVLHLARDPGHEGKQRRVVEAHQPPADYLRFVDRDEASRLAGWPVGAGGWWFPSGGWVNPPSLCAANLAAYPDRITTHYGRSVARIEPTSEGWTAFDSDGRAIDNAPVLILANGASIRSIAQAAALPVRPARGQVSHFAAAPGSPPDVVVCRLGYVGPALDGIRCAGATFAVDDHDPQVREADHRENIAKLEFMLPGYGHNIADAPPSGRVGFRPASPDRLPLVGAIPVPAPVERDSPLERITRQPGLFAVSGFGARGLVWTSLVAELLASQLSGEPLPLEKDLVEAMDPARFLLRPPRRITEEG